MPNKDGCARAQKVKGKRLSHKKKKLLFHTLRAYGNSKNRCGEFSKNGKRRKGGEGKMEKRNPPKKIYSENTSGEKRDRNNKKKSVKNSKKW